MEDFIKNIIIEKNYFELTSSERKSIQGWAATEEEFDALKFVLLAAQKVAVDSEAQLSPYIKQRLDDRFASKYPHKNETLWNRFLIFFFPRDTHLFKKPAFQLAMVALIITFFIPFLWQDKPDQYALNEGRKELEIGKDRFQLKEKSKTEVEDANHKESSNEKSVEMQLNKVQLQPQLDPGLREDDGVDKATAPVFPDHSQVEEIHNDDLIRPTLIETEQVVHSKRESAIRMDSKMEESTYPKKEVQTAETLDLLMALY